jgi:hypothetical protein
MTLNKENKSDAKRTGVCDAWRANMRAALAFAALIALQILAGLTRSMHAHDIF